MSASAPTADEPAIDAPRLVPVFGALMLGILLAALDQTIVGTALPTIVSDLGGLEHISWVVTAYLLATTVSTPLWGKLGDQYGRKRLFQAAIGIFLVGSALCGAAQNMLELIVFRAVQGLGGGGLMVLAMAIVGDVVSPRERGKYQGLFGAVFGVSSVVGPLVGGFFTDGPGWRWVFYVNLPLGALALVVIGLALPARQERRRRTIDYLGTVLLAAAAAAVVLATSWGGVRYPWGSPVIVGLFAAAAVLAAAWLFVERRAAEPVLPPYLFRISVFRMTSALGFIVGFAMFGALTFLPLFLQVVHGVSATSSGLHLLPMTFGLLLTSLASGQIVSRTGHYKAFPIAGMAVITTAMLLLSTLDRATSSLVMSTYFFVLGVGIGLVMQVLVIIVQNAVAYRDLGAATSGATFFRSIGGSFGTSIFGTIFSASLASGLARIQAELPAGFDATALQENRAALDALPPSLRVPILDAYAEAIGTVFLWAAPVALVGLVLALFMRQVPLRASVREPGEGVPGLVRDLDSRQVAERCLADLLRKDAHARDMYVRLGRMAGLDLPAGSIWALARVGYEGEVRGADLAARAQVESARGRPYVDRLVAAGLVERADGQLSVTPAGREAVQRLVDVRRQALAHDVAQWRPEEHPELARLLDTVARRSFDAAPEPETR